MEQNKEEVRLGKFLSLVLRHSPSSAEIKLDENGWADVKQLIQGMCKVGKKIDILTLERIVIENNKQRYSFNADKTKIRANQGHSIPVDIQLKKKSPPDFLYHGTASRFLGSIKLEGIKKQTRQYVHLSADKETALAVGRRHGTPVVLVIDAKKMQKHGFEFYLSENNVWLCNEIGWKYILKAN